MKTLAIMLALLCGLTFLVVQSQDRVISQQRNLIQEMATNPACMQPSPVLTDN